VTVCKLVMSRSGDLNDVQLALRECITHVQATLQKLREEKNATALNWALHHDVELPDRETEALASKAVSVLNDAQHLLQPGHLILADHFLGKCNRLDSYTYTFYRLKCLICIPGYTDSKCLVAAVELGIPDALDTPQSLSSLAKGCSAHPHILQQILRQLVNNNIFALDATSELYFNNRVSNLLRTDHWTQWHNWVSLYGTEFYDIARGIPAAVLETSMRTPAQINFDTDDSMFTHFQSRGWVPRLHKTLSSGATAMAPSILADYPWHEVEDSTVIDIGGGSGALIASLLRAYPLMRGGVYELEHVIQHMTPFFAEGGVYEDLRERVPKENLVSGDFLKWVPQSEVYVIKWTLHNWKDEDAVVILRNVREAMIKTEGKSRLIIFESVVEDGRAGRLARLGGINMMMMTRDGHERTEREWRFLSESAGWSQFRIFPVRRSWVSAIELRL